MNSDSRTLAPMPAITAAVSASSAQIGRPPGASPPPPAGTVAGSGAMVGDCSTTPGEGAMVGVPVRWEVQTTHLQDTHLRAWG
ncbi:MAG: hypothetical protein ACKOE2_00235 [Actinomycetales bacterium]